MRLKKWGTAILILVICMNLLACSKQSSQTDSSSQTDNKGVTVDKNQADVEVTLPASFFDGEDTKETDDEMKEAGVKNITHNKDGSVTYKMSKATHEDLLAKVKKEVDESIQETLEDKENYPSFQSVDYNEDMTKFTVKVDGKKYNEMEAFVAIEYYMEGSLYQIFNGIAEEDANTVVEFVDKDTGKVIDSGDSKSLSEEE